MKSTMVANRISLRDRSGQSMMELLLLLPAMIGLLILMVRSNAAIQVSIVNQKWSRAHVMFLTMNSPVFPSYKLISGSGGMADVKSDQFVLGVAGNVQETEGAYYPDATIIGLKGKQGLPGMPTRGDNAVQSEPKKRDLMRVRNTVTLCTQNNYASTSSGASAILAASNFPNTWGQDVQFCRGGVK